MISINMMTDPLFPGDPKDEHNPFNPRHSWAVNTSCTFRIRIYLLFHSNSFTIVGSEGKNIQSCLLETKV